MQKLDNMDFYDFTFNNHKLSEFNGFVGSNDGGYKTYSLLPTRTNTFVKPLNSNISYLAATSLEPRTFDVPIVFEELHDGDIRSIANWLNSPTPSKFSFIGDTVYINAMLDGNDFNIQTSSGFDGQVSLKFVCPDPYYYNVNLTQYTQSNVKSGTLYSYKNNGTGDLPPTLSISCSGSIKVEILDSNSNVCTSATIDEIVGGIKIDSYNRACTLFSGVSHFAHFKGDYPLIPSGKFSVRITGNNLTNFNIEYRERWL